MTVILCPTRGGQGSYPNQDRAILIAQARAGELVFLYVTNVHFLDQFQSPVLVDIEDELDDMGEFLLAMAQERAEKAGVRARTDVRRGEFVEALQAVVREYEVDTVVLGSPTQGAAAFTTSDYLDDLTRFLLTQAGVEIFLVQDGEIVQHLLPGDAHAGASRS